MKEDIKGMSPLLMVYDMPLSLKFYCDTLGFAVKESAGPPGDTGWALLEWNGVELMLNTQYELPDRPSSPDPKRSEHHGDVILYFGCPDVEGFYRDMKEKGAAVTEPFTTGYGWRAVEMKDPDGYALVFHWPLK